MGMHKSTRRFAAWLACLAMLFAALAPSLAQAVAASRGEAWTEICSASGSRFIKVPVDQAGPSEPATVDLTHLKHCPFCAAQGDAPALPPSFGLPLALPEAGASRPFLFYQSARPLAIWNTAQSRAPPSPA